MLSDSWKAYFYEGIQDTSARPKDDGTLIRKAILALLTKSSSVAAKAGVGPEADGGRSALLEVPGREVNSGPVAAIALLESMLLPSPPPPPPHFSKFTQAL